MDEVIFEEFKGTGNMELQLTEKFNRRIYPAIDLFLQARRDDLLLMKSLRMWILENTFLK
jgi:transcription termination factor Rho